MNSHTYNRFRGHVFRRLNWYRRQAGRLKKLDFGATSCVGRQLPPTFGIDDILQTWYGIIVTPLPMTHQHSLIPGSEPCSHPSHVLRPFPVESANPPFPPLLLYLYIPIYECGLGRVGDCDGELFVRRRRIG